MARLAESKGMFFPGFDLDTNCFPDIHTSAVGHYNRVAGSGDL